MDYEGLNPEGAVVYDNNGALSSKGIAEQDEVPTVNYLPEKGKQHKIKQQLVKSQRRLDDVVRQGFSALDDCVYDTPDQPLGLRKKGHVHRENPYYMSGALLTDPSLGQAEGSSYVVGSVKGAKRDPIASRPPLSTPSISSHKLMQPSELAPPAFYRKQKTLSGSVNDSSTEKSGLYQVEPYSHQLRVTHDPDQSTPSRPHRVPALSGSLWNSSDGIIGEDRGSSQNGSQTFSHEVQPSRSRRRETPVPAPQPWRGLGMENPFSSDPFRTPIKQSWPHRLQALSNDKPQKEQDTPNSSTRQANELSGPDSSPLNKFGHLFADNQKKHEHKSKNHQSH